MSVTYEAVLDVSEDSVLFLSGLLHAERVRVGAAAAGRQRHGQGAGAGVPVVDRDRSATMRRVCSEPQGRGSEDVDTSK